MGVENDEGLSHGPIPSDRVGATLAVQAASRATGDKGRRAGREINTCRSGTAAAASTLTEAALRPQPPDALRQTGITKPEAK